MQPTNDTGYYMAHDLPHAVRARHSYRAILIPQGTNAADLEDLADEGLLPTIRVRAANATQAEAHAHLVTGKGVLRVERVEGGAV